MIGLYEYCLNNNNYLDIVLYNYLKINNIDYKLIDINYKLIISKCNVIGISGDSGSGKSTILKSLLNIFEDNNVLSLETDRYHKWERGDSNYTQYTHLNPYANNLEKMYDDVYDLKIGNEIYQVDYDHNTGKFTQKEKIHSKKNILLCGLHTLYDNKFHELLDIKIFMDTDKELIKKWKIQRDTKERGYSIEKVLQQINNRENDYNNYILIQKQNADIIINFYELNDKLECNLIITNVLIINKIIQKIVQMNYEILIEETNKLIIKLKNEYYDEIFKIIKIII
jgi:uridine kinase